MLTIFEMLAAVKKSGLAFLDYNDVSACRWKLNVSKKDATSVCYSSGLGRRVDSEIDTKVSENMLSLSSGLKLYIFMRSIYLI